jgi:molecular chaperone GrpE (heat shock protein)
MRLSMLFVFLIMPLAAIAQMFKWTDEQGKVHYSDKPPAGKTEVKKVAPAALPATDPATARQALAEREMEARKKQKETKEAADKAEKAKAESEERKENCSRAKADLESIESGLNRFTVDAKGERVALEGAVREQELARARKSVDSWCK